MSKPKNNQVGVVGALWRYPVKSMQGEWLETLTITPRGVLGDRAYALADSSNGNLGSAKNPNKWGFLLSCRARFTTPLQSDTQLPSALITLPDGRSDFTDAPTIRTRLSEALSRDVMIVSGGTHRPMIEKYWPDMEGLDHRDQMTHEEIVENTFFDGDPIHLLTIASLRALSELYPAGQFEARRFRPNIVIYTPPQQSAFIENSWVGATLQIGPEVRLHIKRPTRRCVITTLAVGELPHDLGILRTAAQHNSATVGVYATVLRGGIINQNDAVVFG